MDSRLSFCGLNCETCPIHLATLETDLSVKAEMRFRIAREIARIYGTSPKPEIITDCDGCTIVNGRLFTGCANCLVRNCAMEKGLENCAYCPGFACEKLENHYKYDPESRERLTELRKSINPG